MASQPDIVLIVLDTLRADRLSSYGYSLEITPGLDSLVYDATQFTRCVATAQWTVPTHASLFTGLYPSRHNVSQLDSVLPTTIETLAERLQHVGYVTAGFSHNPLIGVIENGLNRGFDHFASYNNFGAGLLAFHLSENKSKEKRMFWLRRRTRFLLAELLGFNHQTLLHNLSHLIWPVWESGLRIISSTKEQKMRRSLETAAKLLVDRSGISDEQPIFVFINLMGTHIPYDPPSWARKRYIQEAFGQRSAQNLLQRANTWQVDVRNWLEMFPDIAEQKALLDACYNAEVASQDRLVSWFFDLLRTSKHLDNVLLFIVADHGDHLGEKNRLNHAFGVYEELTHVPLIVRDPYCNLPRGKVVSSFVSARRIFHTALTAAGAATPNEERLTLASVNETDQEEDVVISEAQPLEWAIQRLEKYKPGLVASYGYNQPALAIYSARYKLIVTGEHRELYSVDEKVKEDNNLSQVKPNLVRSLEQQLREFQSAQKFKSEMIGNETMDEAVVDKLRNLGYLE